MYPIPITGQVGLLHFFASFNPVFIVTVHQAFKSAFEIVTKIYGLIKLLLAIQFQHGIVHLCICCRYFDVAFVSQYCVDCDTFLFAFDRDAV